MRSTAGETRNLMREPEETAMTVEREREFLRDQAASETGLMLLAEVDGELAGVAIVYANNSQTRLRHRCCVDITLYRKFWGLGMGTVLLGEILTAAGTAGYEQAELEAVSTNEAAAGLYQKLGFQVTGTIPRAFKYKDGTYADFLFMAKPL